MYLNNPTLELRLNLIRQVMLTTPICNCENCVSYLSSPHQPDDFQPPNALLVSTVEGATLAMLLDSDFESEEAEKDSDNYDLLGMLASRTRQYLES